MVWRSNYTVAQLGTHYPSGNCAAKELLKLLAFAYIATSPVTGKQDNLKVCMCANAHLQTEVNQTNGTCLVISQE